MGSVVVLHHAKNVRGGSLLTTKDSVEDVDLAYEVIMEEVYVNMLENTVITEKERCLKYMELAKEFKEKSYGKIGVIS